MDNKAFKYMVELIKDKFSVYYELLSKNLMKTSIFSDIYEKYGTEKICNGESDDILINSINDYIKKNHVEKFRNVNELKEHIRQIVTANPSILSYEKQNSELEYIINKIAVELIDENDFGFYLDQKIIEAFNSYVNVINKELNSCMNEFFKYVFVKVNKNEKNYNYLKDELTIELLKKKNVNLIITGQCDAFIISTYKDLIVKTKEKVKRYIQKYIRNLDFPFYISESLIIEDVNKKIFETGELSLDDLFSGKLNSYIEKNGVKLKKRKDRAETLAYIYQLISHDGQDKTYTEDEYVEFSDEIFKLLVERYNCTLFTISSGKSDDLILKLYSKLVMKRNSVVNKDNPKKIKHKTKKKKMDKILRWLVIITIVSTLVASTISYANMIDYNIASSNVSNFDGYRYDYIYVVNNDRVIPTGINAYNFYKKVSLSGYDENLYGYLSFYNAYQAVRDDRLYIMDSIMNSAKIEASRYDDIVSKTFYEELSSCSCFLEFAMKRLISMGCIEITQPKYVKALFAYQDAKNAPGEGTPMDKISSEQIEVIEEIMKMYRKYSKEYIGKFGDILSNSIYWDDDLEENNSSRRNV